MTQLENRIEFALLFDVTNGNPNGDPDMGNMPRRDAITDHGLVSDVCLKRKIRNFVDLVRGDEPGYRIFVSEGAVLNDKQREAYQAVRPGDKKNADKKLSPKSDAEGAAITRFMCENFFDIRTFGAVMGTSVNCGQVRGAVQIATARSIEPITVQEMTITRMAATNEAEKGATVDEDGDDERRENRTMGRKYFVPYGLYRVHGFISAPLAQKSGFSTTDLDLLIEALKNMFEHDRSAARGEMTARKLVLFKHGSKLGNAPAHTLFERVTVARKIDGEVIAIGDDRLESLLPARAYTDYAVEIDRECLPAGVEVVEVI
jgi:CRISPR-associated protein Csd2